MNNNRHRYSIVADQEQGGENVAGNSIQIIIIIKVNWCLVLGKPDMDNMKLLSIFISFVFSLDILETAE